MTTLLIAIFVIGYLGIAFEHSIHVNKAAMALITGVLCWTGYILLGTDDVHTVVHKLAENMGETSQILFFLLGAMTIVELIDAHEGFAVITDNITTKNRLLLLFLISTITFFLSAILDNLTTTIVMVTILRKLIPDRQVRLFFVSMVVIAANAGGAWSPIGDVTTTMLWIGGQITSFNIMRELFIPSVICLAAPLLFVALFYRRSLEYTSVVSEDMQAIEQQELLAHAPKHTVSDFEKRTVFILGVLALVTVPLFKSITHLPPFMGILLNLGIMWMITELLHKHKPEEHKDALSVLAALKRVDVSSVLFFLGILLAIASLEKVGLLEHAAQWLDQSIGNHYLIGIAIGLLSAIVDNVPLVAASMGMYDLSAFPTDHALWELIAYTAGTGGSCLIIGSAAGVAAMGMERISFGWYLKNISMLALLGYLAGALSYGALVSGFSW